MRWQGSGFTHLKMTVFVLLYNLDSPRLTFVIIVYVKKKVYINMTSEKAYSKFVKHSYLCTVYLYDGSLF